MHEMRVDYGVTATAAELARLRPITAQATFTPRGRVHSASSGGYESAFRGRGLEFDESRAYQPGDDVRAIDWRVSARTGRVHTKLFHEERERPVLILLDERPAMHFGTRDAFKSVQAARAAATLAWAAHDSGDRVGGILLTGAGPIEIPPRRSEARLLHLLRLIGDTTAAHHGKGSVSLADALARLARVSRSGTLALVLSDFHDLDDETERQLGRLALHADTGVVFVYDALEEIAPRARGLRVSDGEQVLRLATADPGLRNAWHARFAARRTRLENFCRRYGIAFLALRTGEPTGHRLAERLARSLRRGTRNGGRA